MVKVAHLAFMLIATSPAAALLEGLHERVFGRIPEDPADRIEYNLSAISPQFHIYNKPSDEPFHTIHWDRVAGPEPLEVQTLLSSVSKLIIAIHGFKESSRSRWLQEMVSLRADDDGVSVMLVDWQKAAKVNSAYSLISDYTYAASHVPLLGFALASLVRRLMMTYDIHPDQVECVGFSLGSQMGGYLTKHLMKHEIRISKLVALDAAAPIFIHQGIMPSRRNVKFLEAVHTSVSDGSLTTLAEGLLGIDKDFGHVDFYPNGGRHQPGCAKWIFTPCNHRRAHELYIEALKEDRCRNFGARCRSYKEALEGNCDSELSQKFFIGMPPNYCKPNQSCIFVVPTSAEPPYCTLPLSESPNEM